MVDEPKPPSQDPETKEAESNYKVVLPESIPAQILQFILCISDDRAFAVKVVPKRLPVFPFSGFDLYHHFRNDAFYGLYNLLKVQKMGKREVVLGQPLPQTLYRIT